MKKFITSAVLLVLLLLSTTNAALASCHSQYRGTDNYITRFATLDIRPCREHRCRFCSKNAARPAGHHLRNYCRWRH